MTGRAMLGRAFFLVVSWVFLVLALSFIVAGCSALYDAAGMSPDEIKETVEDDKTKTITVVKTVRDFFWEAAYGGLAIAGGAVSGWLGVRTHKLNKVNKAVIQGVEKGTGKNVKSCIAAEAKKLGVGDKLHKIVKALT